MSDDFHEEDEPAEEVWAAFEQGEKGFTALPFRDLFRSRWCRVSWWTRGQTPWFRFHVTLGGVGGLSPSLWLNVGRLDIAVHRYE